VTDARPLFRLLLLAALGWLVYLLAPVLTPFLAGALLAYIFNPVVGRLAAWRVPRVAAVVLVFAVLFGLALALALYLLPVMQRSIAAFAAKVPLYVDWLQLHVLPRLRAVFGADLPLDVETLKQTLIAHWQDIGNWLGALAGTATRSGLQLLAGLVNLVLIPIVAFYLLVDGERIPARALALVPRAYRSRAQRLTRESDRVLGSFLRGQLLVMAALAAYYSLCLTFLGLDLALPIGLLAGALSFVPYLGFLTGLIASGVAAYLEFQTGQILVLVLAVFGIGQLLESLVLTPRLVGRQIGLHPVAVIFAVMAGGQLFGFLGILLALPVAAVLKVWLAHAHEAYFQAPRRGAKPRP
jgi:predicted PurR-regulated permease PerM